MARRRRHTGARLAVIAAVVIAGCGDRAVLPRSSSVAVPTTEAPAASTAAAAATATAAATTTTAGADTTVSTTTAATTTTVSDDPQDWTLRPGSEQLAVLDALPGTPVALLGPRDDGEVPVAEGTVDEMGSLLFRDVPAGSYRIAAGDETSDPVRVRSLTATPDEGLYEDQRLPAGGFGYLRTRDGTTLSVNVILPGPVADGPYPTVVEYSGYQPSSPEPSSLPQVLTTLGYAYVGVNMRGTGCSGGSFELFEPVQSLDGYDTVEAIAAQPWVLDHEVGMVGISFAGITQLYVAATRPPSLAAIAPMSVVADMADVVLPGGLLNTGFAIPWAYVRAAETAPSGQAWAAARIAAGDEECAANQRLRLQNVNPVQAIHDHPFTDERTAELAPSFLVDRIEVPTFLAGAWQDEQTGSGFATMIDRFTGTDHLFVSLTNGLHIESLGLGVLPRYLEFLDLYVGKRVPSLEPLRTIAPAIGASVFGTDQVPLPADRFAGWRYRDALRWFQNEQPVQVLFEAGGADDVPPGSPVPRWVGKFDAWPIPGTEARAWYAGPEGLTAAAPAGIGGGFAYRADPWALPATFFDPANGSVWATDVQWNWERPPPGTAVSWESDEFDTAMVLAGTASADLWIRTKAADTDLEVTISEVRDDGREVFVQSGWLRASQRALDEAASTELRPVHSRLAADVAPLPSDDWVLARVEIPPFAHVLRPGSRLRVAIDAPGNSRAVWAFETIDAGEQVEIGWGGAHASRIVLPVVPGVDVPDALPPCTLRGQPCRDAD